MINLLPPEEKGKLLLEEKKRVVLILWLLVLFFLICLSSILFSIKIYSQSRIESQKALLLAFQKEPVKAEIQELQEKVGSINPTLAKLDSFYQQKVYFSEILEKISGILPQGMYLTNLSANLSVAKGEIGVKISLSGFTPTRENLFEFKKNLEKEPGFKKISFPPANWVKPVNINFIVTFEIDNRY